MVITDKNAHVEENVTYRLRQSWDDGYYSFISRAFETAEDAKRFWDSFRMSLPEKDVDIVKINTNIKQTFEVIMKALGGEGEPDTQKDPLSPLPDPARVPDREREPVLV